jgi:proline iminopeptidase
MEERPAVKIDTPFGITDVWEEGSGPPLLILHGGPGLDHGYMTHGLRPLTSRRRLIFFDQLGWDQLEHCKESSAAEATIEHAEIIALAKSSGNSIGILAHSWGNFLALQLLERKAQHISELVMISPFPLTSAGLQASFEILRSRYPKHVVEKRAELAKSEGNGAQIQDLILPYYVVNPNTPLPDELRRYDPRVNQRVFNSLGNFDIEAQTDLLPNSTMVVRGKDDFICIESVKPLMRMAKCSVEMENVGHFPFYEDETQFTKAAVSFLD